MGADIHLYPEYRVDGGAWQSHPDIIIETEGEAPDEFTYIRYDDDGIGRNYSLFADMAGVRGDGLDPLGVPEDISPLVKQAIEYWEADGHSHSYMSLESLKKLMQKRGYTIRDNRMFKSCNKIAKELAKIDKILLDSSEGSVVEFRVVFFFDN